MSKLTITIFKKDEKGEGEAIFDRASLDVDSGWNIFHFPITLTDPGNYRVSITKPEGQVLGSGEVNIVRE